MKKLTLTSADSCNFAGSHSSDSQGGSLAAVEEAPDLAVDLDRAVVVVPEVGFAVAVLDNFGTHTDHCWHTHSGYLKLFLKKI